MYEHIASLGRGCKLVAELPAEGEILTGIRRNNSQDATKASPNVASLPCDENDNDGTIDALNNLCLGIFHNRLSENSDGAAQDIPFVTNVKCMHLLQHSIIDKSEPEKVRLTSNQVCPLLGIHLPLQILNMIDNPTVISDYFNYPYGHATGAFENDYGGHDAKEETNYYELSHVLSSILPFIHPSLTQLQPLGLLRHASHSNYDSNVLVENSPNSRGQVYNILLLRIHMAQSSAEDKTQEQSSEEYAALCAIIEEVHGEAMHGAPSNVIEPLTISQVCFVSRKEEACSVDSSRKHNDPVTAALKSPQETSMGSCSSQNTNMELPMCTVCRYRIQPERLGLPPLKDHQLCSRSHDRRCPNMQFLAPWERSTCEACQLLQKRLELSGAQPFRQPSYLHIPHTDQYQEQRLRDNLKCFLCHIEETLWVCLTCGVVGCGRYSSGHAQEHFIETKHPFSLELATQRIWDYETGSFIQRDDLLNCPYMQQILGAVNRAAYHGAALCGDNVDGGLEFGSTAKKTLMIGEQYEVLLQSALDDQAQHFEGEISRLQAELAAKTLNKGNLLDSEVSEIIGLERMISEMRVKVDNSSRSLVEAQAQEAGHRAKANSLLREQGAMQKALEGAREKLASEEREGQQQIEELEQQVSDITSNIRMREQIANNNDLNQAQIYGTSGEPKQSKSGKRKGSRRGRKK